MISKANNVFHAELPLNVTAVSLFLLLSAYISIPFSPFIAFILGAIFILVTPKRFLVLSYPLLIVSISLICVSRGFFLNYKDDFETYYIQYLNSMAIGSVYFFNSELGLPLLNKLIYSIFGKITPIQLCFIYLLIQFSILTYATVNLYDKLIPNKNVGIKLYLFLFFLCMPLFAPTIFVRQYFSIVFLMLFFSQKRMRYFFLVISVLFHHFSILFVAFIFFLNYISRKKTRLVFNILALSVAFPIIATIFSSEFLLLPKIRAWARLEIDFQLVVFLQAYKFLILSVLISFFASDKIIFRKLSLIVLIALIIDYSFPYMSARFMLPFIVMSGVMIAVCLNEIGGNVELKLIFLSIVFIFLCVKVIKPIIIKDNSYSAIYYSFPIASCTPFYYLDDFYNENKNRNR